MRVFRGGFAAGDKVTYNGTELLCHGCVVAATSAPERPTYVSPVQSVATRPQGIPVSDQLHSPDSDFSTSGKQSVYQLWFHTVHVLLTVILIRTLVAQLCLCLCQTVLQFSTCRSFGCYHWVQWSSGRVSDS